MGELNVLSLSGLRYKKSICPFPASIQRLSNLRTLCLSNLMLDDISIIGELVTLEILSIRDSELEELPVEMGKLTNLILVEFWIDGGALERISAGVLSRLVRLEELHMVGVKHCSYSTLRELESLSRLTALTLSHCSGDVIHYNLGFPSKLTRYALTAGRATSSVDDYDKNIALEVNDTAPLADWIRHLLKESGLVHSIGKGSNNVLTELKRNELQNVKDLSLSVCDLVTHLLSISGRSLTHEVIKLPNLCKLHLEILKCLNHFCSDTVEGIEFPRLRKMIFTELPKFQNFWPTTNNSITHSNPLFHDKVSCPNLEELHINGANSISAVCSQQLPTAYFSKLKKLRVYNCGKLRNLMSPSVARGLLNLQELYIRGCLSMEEVITKGGEIMTLFPLLEKLSLESLPKLGHFFFTEHALKFPILKALSIVVCPEMKTFVQQGISMSTPNLNKAMFNSKVSCPNLERLRINGANSISALCSHRLPTAYFTKLVTLEVFHCPKLRNLMSPSVARGLLYLQLLMIEYCESIEEVITNEEQQGEGIMTLFPRLVQLHELPKLRHFFLSECTLEIPFLEHVCIGDCPEMKTFVQQGICVSTPSLELVNGINDVKVDDLNKWTQQRFTSKGQIASQGTTSDDQSEANDGDESEAADSDKSDSKG